MVNLILMMLIFLSLALALAAVLFLCGHKHTSARASKRTEDFLEEKQRGRSRHKFRLFPAGP
jgi:hypothetical protein